MNCYSVESVGAVAEHAKHARQRIARQGGPKVLVGNSYLYRFFGTRNKAPSINQKGVNEHVREPTNQL